MLESRVFNLGDLVRFEQRGPIPGNPPWADLHFGSATDLPAPQLRGPGIYEFFFNERPLYLGKFCGTTRDAFGGDALKTRWIPHAGTLTLRSRTLSLSAAALREIYALRNGPTLGPVARQLVLDLQQADQDALTRDRGCVSAKHRFLFAAEQWAIFRWMTPEVLRLFRVLYAQVQPDTIATRLGAVETRKRVSDAEGRLIREVLRPRCNREAGHYAPRLDCEIGEAREAIEQALRQAFQAPAETERLAAADGREFAGGARQPPPPPEDAEIADDEASGDASEQFFESIADTPAACTLVDRVAELAAQLEAEVHHTRTHGGDFRIRCGRPAGRPLAKNVLAMYWQRSGVFECEIGVPLDRCQDMAAAKKRVNYRGHPLPTLLSVEPGVDDMAFLRIVELAIRRFRAE